jgi:hypothetical protein
VLHQHYCLQASTLRCHHKLLLPPITAPAVGMHQTTHQDEAGGSSK